MRLCLNWDPESGTYLMVDIGHDLKDLMILTGRLSGKFHNSGISSVIGGIVPIVVIVVVIIVVQVNYNLAHELTRRRIRRVSSSDTWDASGADKLARGQWEVNYNHDGIYCQCIWSSLALTSHAQANQQWFFVQPSSNHWSLLQAHSRLPSFTQHFGNGMSLCIFHQHMAHDHDEQHRCMGETHMGLARWVWETQQVSSK